MISEKEAYLKKQCEEYSEENDRLKLKIFIMKLPKLRTKPRTRQDIVKSHTWIASERKQ